MRWNGSGSSGSIARSASTIGGTIANVSRTGPRSRTRPQEVAAVGLGAEVGRHHDRERAAAGERGHVRDRREVDDRRPRHQLVGQRRQQRAPRPQHLGRALDREEHGAGVQLVDGIDLELDRGHDAEVAAAAAQRPEQVGVVLGVGAHEAAVGGDDLERGDGVGLQAELARQPADAAAERVPGDPDVRRRAVQRGEAVRREPPDDALPLGAGADAHALGAGVDSDLLEPADVQQQRVLEVAERALVVAGRLRGDTQPHLAGVGDRRDDTLVVGGQRDRGRVLVEQEIEGGAGFIPAGVAGEQESQRGERGEHAAMVRIAARAVDPRTAGLLRLATPTFQGVGGGLPHVDVELATSPAARRRT